MKSAYVITYVIMMMSSNGSSFVVTGPLCRELTGDFLSQRDINADFDSFAMWVA